jgi:hypothetical protein
MDDGAETPKSARAPTPADVARIAERLNALGARYAVVGGYAMAHHGSVRPTMDLDLLVDPSPENVTRVCEALAILEDRAALEMKATDVAEYTVVRVADEIVVDVMASAAGVPLSELEIEYGVTGGVRIPYPTAPSLLRTKQTVRDKDAPDRRYLESLIEAERR